MAVFSWFGDACSCTRKKCDPSCMTYAHYLEERKPMTNADRIRSMTDEELAVWLAKITDCGECPVWDKFPHCTTSEESCACRWHEWLKEEVKK